MRHALVEWFRLPHPAHILFVGEVVGRWARVGNMRSGRATISEQPRLVEKYMYNLLRVQQNCLSGRQRMPMFFRQDPPNCIIYIGNIGCGLPGRNSTAVHTSIHQDG